MLRTLLVLLLTVLFAPNAHAQKKHDVVREIVKFSEQLPGGKGAKTLVNYATFVRGNECLQRSYIFTINPSKNGPSTIFVSLTWQRSLLSELMQKTNQDRGGCETPFPEATTLFLIAEEGNPNPKNIFGVVGEPWKPTQIVKTGLETEYKTTMNILYAHMGILAREARSPAK